MSSWEPHDQTISNHSERVRKPAARQPRVLTDLNRVTSAAVKPTHDRCPSTTPSDVKPDSTNGTYDGSKAEGSTDEADDSPDDNSPTHTAPVTAVKHRPPRRASREQGGCYF